MSRNNRNLKNFEVLMIEIFRLYLFFGMVIHKLVWEMLKKKDAAHPVADLKPQSTFKFLVKTVKVIFLIIFNRPNTISSRNSTNIG